MNYKRYKYKCSTTAHYFHMPAKFIISLVFYICIHVWQRILSDKQKEVRSKQMRGGNMRRANNARASDRMFFVVDVVGARLF